MSGNPDERCGTLIGTSSHRSLLPRSPRDPEETGAQSSEKESNMAAKKKAKKKTAKKK